jgi:formamidopyrimidine-DNA glycosylase
MPEGDTLWNHAADLRPALVGHKVTDLRVHRNRKKGPRPGVSVASVEAAGKHLLIEFDDGVILHSHLQMTGEWHLYKPDARWQTLRGGLAVYGKNRRGCPRCHTGIKVVEHGDDLKRLSYWCARCQPAYMPGN